MWEVELRVNECSVCTSYFGSKFHLLVFHKAMTTEDREEWAFIIAMVALLYGGSFSSPGLTEVTSLSCRSAGMWRTICDSTGSG